MKLRLLIHTPKGQAKQTAQNLRVFLLGLNKPSETGYTEDSFFWELELSYKAYVNLTKRVYLFQSTCAGVMDSKTLIKAAKTLGATEAQIKEVRAMLTNGTSIDIIKTAQAEEIVEANTTFWEKLKRRFSREQA